MNAQGASFVPGLAALRGEHKAGVIPSIQRLTPMSIPEATLPTLLRDSVILEPDRVRILDRRVFPFQKSFVECRNYEEVARAIEDMVTQSNGPFFASSAGLVLAGLVAVPINFRLVGPEIRYIVENCEAGALIVQDQLIDAIEQKEPLLRASFPTWRLADEDGIARVPAATGADSRCTSAGPLS